MYRKMYFNLLIFLGLIVGWKGVKAQSIEFAMDINSEIPGGANGFVGVIFFNNQYWISKWNSNDLHILDKAGKYVETFQIPGVTGVRSMTTDGVNIFCGTASDSIYEVDPITKKVINTISVNTTSDAITRFCAYSAALDGGLGGFWIGSYGSDIASIDRNGNELSVIPKTTHNLTAMYGAAVDGLGKLYIYDQSGPNSDRIVRLQLPAGGYGGPSYDVFANVVGPMGSTASLGGGLFISGDIVPGKKVVVGLSQSLPNNIVFGLDYGIIIGADENDAPEKIQLFPNPARDRIFISGCQNSELYIIYNLIGVEVTRGRVSEIQSVDIDDLAPGIYFMKLKQGAAIRFVKE